MQKEVEAFCEGYIMAAQTYTFVAMTHAVVTWARAHKLNEGQAKGYALIWYNARMKRLGLA